MNPALLEAARKRGSDKQYLEWLTHQPSANSGEFSEWVNGEGRSVACHVRRAATSGTGYKPEYQAIPLSDAEHKLTHQKGESALASKEWFDEQAEHHLLRWIESGSA